MGRIRYEAVITGVLQYSGQHPPSEETIKAEIANGVFGFHSSNGVSWNPYLNSRGDVRVLVRKLETRRKAKASKKKRRKG